MEIVNLVQGSTEWAAYRLTKFNASDAPAMMGCSPYKTRAQLIKEVATGLTEEVDAQTQRLFDDGHRTEALARPIAEKIIGEDLSPVVGTNGPLSASFDGLTFLYDKSFECKRLNKRLREAMVPGCTGADLPLDYQVQMEQQHAVNEAGEKTLFVAAEFDAEGNLVEERHCWYTPNLELRAKIVAGWKQFEADVAAYQPAEVVAPVAAEAVESLPAVVVKVSGEIAIIANFAAFQVRLQAFLDNQLVRAPKTDQDFATLDQQIKAMKEAEAALDAAEGQMLAQIASVDTAKKTKDMLYKLVRDNRLMSEKLLAQEKDRRKSEIVSGGHLAAREHCATLTKRVGVTVSVSGDFAGVIKGKKSLASMEDAIATELARVKIEASQVADLIDANRKAMEEADAAGLFPDFAQVCTKQSDDFANLIAGRRAAAQARMEAERERIRAEEVARLEREQRTKEEAEARARADEAARQQAQAEAAARELEEAERRAKAAADAAALSAASAEAASAVAGRPVNVARTATEPLPAPAPEVRAFVAPAANEAPSLKLGELWTALGLDDREAFIASVGFPATPAPKGTGKLYRHSDLNAIRRAIAKRMTEDAEQKQAA